ncbi:LOW QUALITY PROTEIN: SLAM family member 8-like [Spheniscus humboldti]
MFTPSKPVSRAVRSRLRARGVRAMGMSPGRPRPRIPWPLAPLLVVAGAMAARPRQVNGVLGGSVLLSPALPHKMVKEIEWSFLAGAGATIQVAEFGPRGFERPDPKDRFKDRLEMFDETALKIGALERGDSGVYGARIKLHPAEVEDQSFNLSVYGLVPAPEIQHRLLSLTPQGCNVTLRCWVPADSDAEAAWQLGGSLGTPWGQLCEDSQTLCLAVPASAFNSCYTCVARNPIQERSVSICLDALCRQQETRGWRSWHVCLVLLVVSVGALLGITWLWRKKRRKKAAEGATLASPSSEDAPLEPLYTEIQRRNTPEADEWQRDHPTTIYSQVQAGAGGEAETMLAKPTAVGEYRRRLVRAGTGGGGGGGGGGSVLIPPAPGGTRLCPRTDCPHFVSGAAGQGPPSPHDTG